MPSVQGDTLVKAGRPDSGQRGEPAGHSWLAAERDTSIHSMSFSEEVEVPISQPIQSVTVRQKTSELLYTCTVFF